MHILYKW